MSRLQKIFREEYVLSYKDLKMERRVNGKERTDEEGFIADTKNLRLRRYKDSYVAYKRGLLCGQSLDKDVLLEDAVEEHCLPVSIFKVE